MKTLGERIKEIRIEKGLSQNALGRIIGVSKSSVCQWEKGKTKYMTGSNMINTAQALGVNPRWLESGMGDTS